MEISEGLRRAREAKGMSKSEVAAAIGMHRPSYVRYERPDGATRTPRIEQLIALSDLYDVSLDYLVGRTDNPEVNR